MEEADMRLGETKKAGYEFERDIVKGSVNQRTDKIVAEKVVRYFEDKIRSRVSSSSLTSSIFQRWYLDYQLSSVIALCSLVESSCAGYSDRKVAPQEFDLKSSKEETSPAVETGTLHIFIRFTITDKSILYYRPQTKFGAR